MGDVDDDGAVVFPFAVGPDDVAELPGDVTVERGEHACLFLGFERFDLPRRAKRWRCVEFRSRRRDGETHREGHWRIRGVIGVLWEVLMQMQMRCAERLSRFICMGILGVNPIGMSLMWTCQEDDG